MVKKEWTPVTVHRLGSRVEPHPDSVLVLTGTGTYPGERAVMGFGVFSSPSSVQMFRLRENHYTIFRSLCYPKDPLFGGHMFWHVVTRALGMFY